MRILVIGDSCKDVFIYGDCSRLAPAAPVPVFVEKYRKTNKGMAGNVYENVLSLGVKCDIITNKAEIIKTRYVEKKTNHMIVRVDSDEEKIDRIKDINIEALQQYDAVIISDYNKGFLLEEDIQFIADNHELVFLDTKKLLGDWARNINFIKINEQEYERTRHLLVDKEWLDEKLIVTMGARGCIYNGNIYRVLQVEIKDLTGAGDSFLAALVYKFVKEADIISAIKYANECATRVVQQKGVNTIK
jgi:D-beta-D-heptose 7-phosphate kinase/D-beta-D-heptose 1-phosphate adenosyltransferase